MKMQFKPYSVSYYQAEKENMIYRISAVRNEPDGHTTAVLENTFGGNYIAYGCIAAYMVISIVVGRLPFLP